MGDVIRFSKFVVPVCVVYSILITPICIYRES